MEWHLWYILLSCVNNGLKLQKRMVLNKILLTWWEVTLCDGGQGFLNFLTACMIVGRWKHQLVAQIGNFSNKDGPAAAVESSVSSTEMRRILSITEVRAGLELYTQLDHRWNPNNPDVSGSGRTVPVTMITKEQLVARRSLSIPHWVIDKHTFRGKGYSTHQARVKFLDRFKLAYLDLTGEQWAVSHGAGKSYKDTKTGPMIEFWDHLRTVKSENDALYFDAAKRLYMQEAEQYGYGNAKTAYVAERLYKSEWIKHYGLTRGNDDDDDEMEETEGGDGDKKDRVDEDEEGVQPSSKRIKTTVACDDIPNAQDVLSKEDMQLLYSGEAPFAQRPTATKFGK